MRHQQYPCCCGARIIYDLGGTWCTLGGNLNALPKEKFNREIERLKKEYFKENMFLILINGSQKKSYNQMLLDAGFKEVNRVVGGHGYLLHLYCWNRDV